MARHCSSDASGFAPCPPHCRPYRPYRPYHAQDTYKQLPSKTLRLLALALSSGCGFSHVAKVDDDVYLRPHMLLRHAVLGDPMAVPRPAATAALAQQPLLTGQQQQAQQQSGLLVGSRAGLFANAAHGFHPIRNPQSK